MKSIYLSIPIFLMLCCCNQICYADTVHNFSFEFTCPNGPDIDEDGICDDVDICLGFDDNIDLNGNGLPDGCENGSTPSCINFTYNPPDKTVDCSLPIVFDQPSAVDNCCGGFITYTFVDSSENPYAGCEIFTRVWIAQSTCGNMASIAQTITHIDNEAPEFVIDHPILSTINSGDTITVDCEDGFFIANGDVSAVDNCDDEPVVSLFDEITDGNCPNDGYTKFMLCYWVAIDNCANKDTFEVFIKFIDTTAPQISCPSDVTVECMASIDPADTGEPWVGDDCTDMEDIEITFVDESSTLGDCTTLVTRTWTATDDCGNFTTCEQLITQTDATPPIITCPADTTIDCDASADVAITGIATATDDCSTIDNITFQDQTDVLNSCETQITRTWIAEDACGNQATCVQIIILRDLTNPAISCPADADLECGDSTDPNNTGYPTGTDNCDPELEFAFEDEVISINTCEIIINRTWTAVDNCSNFVTCMQVLKITDSTAPMVSCPANITIECTDSTDPDNTGYPTGADGCDNDITFSFVDNATANGCETTITRTWTGTDDCGNTATCVQIITLIDTVIPEISCPPNITIECMTSNDPSITGFAIATDICDNDVEVTFEDITLVTTDCEILFNRVWMATDNCGNTASCSQLITENDSTPPLINCPNDVTIECNTSTDPSVTGTATGSDDCDDGVDIAFSDETNQIDNCTTITIRTWSATNDCGAVTTCEQVITINDSQNPMITCPVDITVECMASFEPQITGFPSATDNCALNLDISYSDNEVQINVCETAIERTWTAVDDCGNSVSCMQTIKILDTTLPEIICPSNITVECNASTDPDNTGEPTLSDNCMYHSN